MKDPDIWRTDRKKLSSVFDELVKSPKTVIPAKAGIHK